MTGQVWKFPLPLQDRVTIAMPKGAAIVHVAAQNEEPHLWALVNPDPACALEERVFRVAGTGHPIDVSEGVRHVGSFLMLEDALVWHVFEVVGVVRKLLENFR